ncbi:SAM-dependent methyltransferase [Embleya scabrispora]|uniref:SAM-dependent methyltransferase n=1 Tax=Embleya scabrispora TaxID=159449 RepID=A0A1T3P3Q0_9ACTN|nr:O-methyltransferase [Embleya scabrispora]OPC83634.1 SAM-dependent methyltransferase [Embleya scabrispora]
MSFDKQVRVTPELYDYVLDHSLAPDPAQRTVIERTRGMGGLAGLQVPAEQGALLTLLSGVVRPRVAVEVGTFTGYSALCIAKGLAADGRLLCCDVSEEWTDIARETWREAGVADRIDLRIAPALETLDALPSHPHIDLAFIDANKDGYISYWEALVPRMRPNGLLIADNVLYGGQVLKPDGDPTPAAVHAFNEHVKADRRVEPVMLPVADGITLARVRALDED